MRLSGISCGNPEMNRPPYREVVTPGTPPGLPTTTDVPSVMPPPIPLSPEAGVVAGDGATRVEITPDMIGFLSTALGNVPPELWEPLLAQMSPVEVAGFFQSVSAQVTQTEMMREHLAQQAQAKPAGDTPEPTPATGVMDVEQVRVLLSDELAAEYEVLATDEERVDFLIANNLIENPIRRPNPDEIIILHDSIVRGALGDALADQYIAMSDEEKRQFWIDHSLVMPLTEDGERPASVTSGIPEFLAGKTPEELERIAEREAKRALLEEMATSMGQLSAGVEDVYGRSTENLLGRLFLKLSKQEQGVDMETYFRRRVFDLMVFVGSLGADNLMSRRLGQTIFNGIAFIGGKLGVSIGKDGVLNTMWNNLFDRTSDSFIEKVVNNEYQAFVLKEFREYLLLSGYTDDQIETFFESGKIDSPKYVTDSGKMLAGLGRLLLTDKKGDPKRLGPFNSYDWISGSSVSAVENVVRNSPVVAWAIDPVLKVSEWILDKFPFASNLWSAYVDGVITVRKAKAKAGLTP